MPKNTSMASAIDEVIRAYVLSGRKSKRALDKLIDARIEAIALERIKTADPSKFLTYEELKAKLGILD